MKQSEDICKEKGENLFKIWAIVWKYANGGLDFSNLQ